VSVETSSLTAQDGSGLNEQPSNEAQDAPESPGERIGSYQNCHYIASGVTSAVYRCQSVALKVIVETRNIEPHNPIREAKILATLKKPCIPLLETFRDQEQRFTLVFPYMPLTLADVIESAPLPAGRRRAIFHDVFTALAHIHSQGIIHRDLKPSALLLPVPDGPAYLSDFGTAWHPALSATDEPAASKVLDIGTGPYRAPEVLFGQRAYGPAVDMWAAGAVLAECCRAPPPRPLFESRAAHEDGNQLGLILSIFKTIGSPTPESWPEARAFRTPPFEMYRAFAARPWEEVLPDVEGEWRALVAALVRFDSGRMTAEEVSCSICAGWRFAFHGLTGIRLRGRHFGILVLGQIAEQRRHRQSGTRAMDATTVHHGAVVRRWADDTRR
jgi:cyclin-dependent kinase